MAEELQDAAYTLPRTMVWATIINGGLMFIMAITICYVIGDVGEGLLASLAFIKSDADILHSTQN